MAVNLSESLSKMDGRELLPPLTQNITFISQSWRSHFIFGVNIIKFPH